MTASLYRRLVDLPPGLLSMWPEARTTAEVVRDTASPEIAAGMVCHACEDRDQRVFVGVLPNASTLSEAATIARLEADAKKAKTRQTVKDYRKPDDWIPQLGVVVCLWDGRIRAEASQRSRSRRDKRFTLDSDVLRWVEREAERRGVSQSAVVQDALREGMR